jgi:cytohesin
MFTALASDKNGGSGGVSGMAGWFSSLRRQPKNKKSNDKKSMQKSCVDLTTNNIYYDVPPAKDLPLTISTIKDSTNNESCSSDINIVDSESKCTCDITTTTNVETIRTKTNVKTSDCHKIPKNNTATTTKTETNSQSIYSVRHKEELRTTTTTKITKTTVVNRQKTYRVGLIFDEDGELMSSNLDLWQLSNRCKSRDRLVFDQSGNLVITNNSSSNNINNNNNNNSSTINNFNEKCDKPLNLLNDENIEFIDCTNAGDDIYNTDQATTICKNCKNRSKSFVKSNSDTQLNSSNKVIVW